MPAYPNESGAVIGGGGGGGGGGCGGGAIDGDGRYELSLEELARAEALRAHGR